jgi:general secretion pathway protein M
MQVLERRLIPGAQADLQKMKELQNTYWAQQTILNNINESLAKRQKDFAIFSFLEELATQSGLKSNILYMKPSVSTQSGFYRESSVELKVDGVTLKQLTQYLYQIESSPQLLKIRKLHIKPRSRSQNLLEATFQVSTFYLP